MWITSRFIHISNAHNIHYVKSDFIFVDNLVLKIPTSWGIDWRSHLRQIKPDSAGNTAGYLIF